jgi:hypothetical protein
MAIMATGTKTSPIVTATAITVVLTALLVWDAVLVSKYVSC